MREFFGLSFSEKWDSFSVWSWFISLITTISPAGGVKGAILGSDCSVSQCKVHSDWRRGKLNQEGDKEPQGTVHCLVLTPNLV